MWSRPDPARDGVQPGDGFVDVGGLEECFPTIGGPPDHGDVWTRAWQADGDRLTAETGACRLTRRVCVGERVVADYRLTGPPGLRFIWAAHALLDPALGTVVDAPAGHPCRAWPGHVRPVHTTWPRVLDIDGYDTLGDDDGSAMFCLLPGLDTVTVRAAPRSASTWSAPAGRSRWASGATWAVTRGRARRRTGTSASSRCSAGSSTFRRRSTKRTPP
ncbi:MAG: hypothetical protein HOV96_41670 [Nonomuraea sp.]|nr:hypothetical protein [Streptomyces sp.]NUP84057.1 hypothetical protein [Nonomuraea sp.]NUS07248.1 hypothetical protein [Nonomuraea sp.]